MAALALTLFQGPAYGQNANTGALAGTVTDASGAVVPGAAIRVTNQATGESRTVTSQTGGLYSVPLLPPQHYQVEVSKQGFKTLTFPSVTVGVAETATLNVKLEVGVVTEHVTVEAIQEQLQTESAQLGTVTNARMINDLPLAARNYLQIVTLNPGYFRRDDKRRRSWPGRGQPSRGERRIFREWRSYERQQFPDERG